MQKQAADFFSGVTSV